LNARFTANVTNRNFRFNPLQKQKVVVKKSSDYMEGESKNMFFDAIFEKQHHVDFYHHQTKKGA